MLTAALQELLGPVYDTLTAVQLTALIDDLTWTLDDLTAGQIQRQSVTYLAYPVMNSTSPTPRPAAPTKGRSY
ncbi:MAG: hypothetical protein ACRDKW_08385 [Actinomycetota bacterium]